MSKALNLAQRQYNRSIGLVDIYDQNQTSINLLKQLKSVFEQSKTIYKKTYEESKDEKINSTLQKLIPHYKFLSNIEDINIADDELIHDLIFELGSIMKICSEIINLIEDDDRDKKYLMRLSIIVHDLIKKVKAERFTKRSIDLLNKTILKIINGNVTREDVIEIDLEFMDKGFNWVIGG